MEAVQANFGGGHHTKDTPREIRNRKLCHSSLLVVHPISSPISALIPIPDFIPNAISRLSRSFSYYLSPPPLSLQPRTTRGFRQRLRYDSALPEVDEERTPTLG